MGDREDRMVKAGWLHKQSRSVFARLQKRWVEVCRSPPELHYYLEPGGTLRGKLRLVGAIICRAKRARGEYTSVIRIDSRSEHPQPKLILCCESEDECLEWMKALCGAVEMVAPLEKPNWMELRIQIVQGRCISHKADASPRSYCTVAGAGEDVLRTRTWSNSEAPAWNESFVIACDPQGVITVHCWCMRPVGAVELLGTVSVLPSAMSDKWYSFGEDSQLRIVVSDARREHGIIPHAVGYKMHLSPVGGAMQLRGEAYPVFQLNVQGVSTHFGFHMQGWNKDYASAKLIFGPGPQAASARALVRVEHMLLYWSSRYLTRCGVLRSGWELAWMLGFGVRDGIRRRFTYVLSDTLLLLSETGPLLTDVMSKHAVHAGASDSVRYAGEFMFDVDEDGAGVWRLDNNSGTYAPDAQFLPNLAALLRDNFEGLRVETQDHTEGAQHEKEIGQDPIAFVPLGCIPVILCCDALGIVVESSTIQGVTNKENGTATMEEHHNSTRSHLFAFSLGLLVNIKSGLTVHCAAPQHGMAVTLSKSEEMPTYFETDENGFIFIIGTRLCIAASKKDPESSVYMMEIRDIDRVEPAVALVMRNFEETPPTTAKHQDIPPQVSVAEEEEEENDALSDKATNGEEEKDAVSTAVV